MDLVVSQKRWELERPFRISGHEWRHIDCLVVELRDGNVAGFGEAEGVSYLDETVESMRGQIVAIQKEIEAGLDRESLQRLLPRGGARNALDCALWDLEAKRSGRTIWDLTGIEPAPVTTVFTIGLEPTPEEMAAKASAARGYPVLKVKLDADRPVARLEAIRGARPDAAIVVDANQGWTFRLLEDVLPRCAELGIDMIEQPLPRGGDAELEGFESPVPLCADESCQDREELDAACARYDMINIKLDKTGGLTEALALAEAARERGAKLMVGNMLGTSLAMAPSFVVAQLCDFVDIDGPLLLKSDRPGGLRYDRGRVRVFTPDLWG